jgi:hypothetical protein
MPFFYPEHSGREHHKKNVNCSCYKQNDIFSLLGVSTILQLGSLLGVSTILQLGSLSSIIKALEIYFIQLSQQTSTKNCTKPRGNINPTTVSILPI